uniref:Uncharacterized protein n=1 Tax=Arcella intermedia TaxID=1963864 RepID=A0A6B2L171_9EUKA
MKIESPEKDHKEKKEKEKEKKEKDKHTKNVKFPRSKTNDEDLIPTISNSKVVKPHNTSKEWLTSKSPDKTNRNKPILNSHRNAMICRTLSHNSNQSSKSPLSSASEPSKNTNSLRKIALANSNEILFSNRISAKYDNVLAHLEKAAEATIQISEKTVAEMKNKRETLQLRYSHMMSNQISETAELEDLISTIKEVDEELELQTQQYNSILSKRHELIEKRASLLALEKRTRRPLSIAVKTVPNQTLPTVQNPNPIDKRPSVTTPSIPSFVDPASIEKLPATTASQLPPLVQPSPRRFVSTKSESQPHLHVQQPNDQNGSTQPETAPGIENKPLKKEHNETSPSVHPFAAPSPRRLPLSSQNTVLSPRSMEAKLQKKNTQPQLSARNRPSMPVSDTFTIAFESVWSTLVNKSASFLLEEGLKRGKISRGFWFLMFESPEHLIRIWSSGLLMDLRYIGGGSDVAHYYSGGDKEFVETVTKYDIQKTVCFLMVTDLGNSTASAWGVIDV